VALTLNLKLGRVECISWEYISAIWLVKILQLIHSSVEVKEKPISQQLQISGRTKTLDVIR